MLGLVALASGVFAAAAVDGKTPVQVVLAAKGDAAVAVVICRTGQQYEAPAVLPVENASFVIKAGKCAGTFKLLQDAIEWRRNSKRQRLGEVCRPRVAAKLAVEGWHSSLRHGSGGDAGYELILLPAAKGVAGVLWSAEGDYSPLPLSIAGHELDDESVQLDTKIGMTVSSEEKTVRLEFETGVLEDLDSDRSFFASAKCKVRAKDDIPERGGEDGSIRLKYGNCSYGYTATLPEGIVAYGTLPPNPDHGFEIDPANPASPPPDKLARFISVDASRDSGERKTARGAVKARRGDPDGRTKVDRTFMGRTPALRSISIHGDHVVETVVALQRGIVFTAGLATTAESRAADEQVFEKILRGLDLAPAGLDCSDEQ
jgi:hypothetical protein